MWKAKQFWNPTSSFLPREQCPREQKQNSKVSLVRRFPQPQGTELENTSKPFTLPKRGQKTHCIRLALQMGTEVCQWVLMLLLAFLQDFGLGLRGKLYIRGLSQKPWFIQLKARVHTSQPLLHMFSVRSQVPRSQIHQKTESSSSGKDWTEPGISARDHSQSSRR